MPATAPIRVPKYCRREPEKEPLYQILAGHLETFVQQARTSEHRLPLHVEKEMRAYLECGMLAYGFVRARCEDCGTSRAIAFSCKRRGFCPSYSGRRMADTAARLADDVLPRVPVRQWVLSFPYEIRYRLAYDGELVATVLAGARTLVPLRGPTGPGGGASTHPRFPAPLLRAQNAVVGWDQPPGTVSPELLERLAALVPPPRLHLLRYHGVLAPCARDRDRIVPAKPVAESLAADGDPRPQPCGHRLGWAALLARVFAAELSQCAA